MPSQTKMNTLNFIFNSKNKKILWVVFLILIIVIFYILRQLFFKDQLEKRITVPIIPPTTTITKVPQTPLDTSNPHNPTQKLVFNWGSVFPEIPQTMDNYLVSTPLITKSSISTMADKLGFTVSEISPYTDENSLLWINSNRSFFGSPKQNQILFNSTGETPKHLATISKDEALDISKKIISNLFGESLLSTLNINSEVKYLNLNPEREDDPQETTPFFANIININFQQTIDRLQLLSLSKKGETISIAIDTNKKLYILYVYGGYQNLTKKETVNLIDFSRLIEIAPISAIRISQSKDIPSESAYTESKNIIINVKAISLGYFQRADNSLFPVFIINGNMSAKGLEEYPAIYIVPATQ